jgi:1-acyl-sn-glycerol-3-phosphate acyltransferase
MAALRSLLFLAIFYGGTLVFVLLALLSLPFGRTGVRAVANAWARFHSACARSILGIGVRIEGLVPQGGVLIAAKHEAMFETLEMPVLLANPAVVMKRELARIPIWGWLAGRYGMIAIDRDGGAASLRHMLKAAGAAVAEGRAVIIFPEGTRVKHGEAPPLQPGFAGLYRALGLPIVPLALDSGRCWGRTLLGKKSGIVTFRFGDPIPPGLPRREAEARVHAAINALNSLSPAGRGLG